MQIQPLTREDASRTGVFFESVFIATEGVEESKRIADLARQLLTDTRQEHVFGLAMVDQGTILGAILFSRLTFSPPLEAFILAPVAVHLDHQRRGIGQSLISHGLDQLTRRGVRFVATYGDPAFYRRVGFHPISPQTIRPPFTLSQPEGWLGQSLTEEPLTSFAGPVHCVDALENPHFW